MRLAPRILALLLTMTPWSLLQGQAPPTHHAAGAGLLVADRGPSGYLDRLGPTAFLRLAWPRRPLLLEVSMQHVGHADIAIEPCLPPCTSTPVASSTALTLAPAAQLTWRWPRAAWLFRVGPSFHWLLELESGSDAMAAGLRAGISARRGQTEAGLLLSADYFRLFRSGSAPRWFVPVTLGWQF